MGNSDESKTNLRDRVLKWLGDEGYPLEFRTANAFRKNHFDVSQGMFVTDIESGIPREVDVVAHGTTYGGDHHLRIEYVVECKYSMGSPWVVFTSPTETMHPAACISHTLGSAAAEAALWALAGDDELQSLDTFHAPPRPGFGGTRTLSKKADAFYSAIQSVVSAASAILKDYDSYHETPAGMLKMPVVILPVIVVEGRLFEAYFDSQAGEMAPDEIEQARVHWRGSQSMPRIVNVDLVTTDRLDGFVAQRALELPQITAQMMVTLRQLRECMEQDSLTPLDITSGPRGLLGLPRFLQAAITPPETDTEDA